nr:MAG TPA: rich Immunoreceptor tyrosine-based activation motif [Caudoviricetes sp.]
MVAVFPLSAGNPKSVTFSVFPTCYLPVSYFPIFTTFYTISHLISFFRFQAPKKYRNRCDYGTSWV